MVEMKSEKQYYDKKYLNEASNSQGFLSSISYAVQLCDLLQLRKSCTYHKNMKYAPVLFEIMVQRLKDYYRGNYFLQLWDNEGNKVYEKVLKYDIISWNIFHNYLVYKTDKKEENGSQLIVVDFRKGFKEIRVKSFIGDKTFVHLGINQGLLYYANQRVIKIVDIEVNFSDKETHVDIDPKPDQIASYDIKSGCRLHGFFENGFSQNDQYIMCMIETFDNQIDFNRLYNWDRNVQSPSIVFYQYREVVQRELRNDPVVKITQMIMSDEFQFGAVLRQSGQVDLYWNYTLTQTPNESNFTDVNSNFTSLYLKQEQQETKKILKIDLRWDSRIGIDVAVDVKFTEEFWFKIQNDSIKNFVKVFSATTLINTTFLIAYNNVVSSFDIIKKLWIDHYIMDEQVVDLLRNQFDQESDDYYVGILLKNGKIFELETTKVQGEMVWTLKGAVSHNVGLGIKKIVSDWRDVSSHYLYLEQDKGHKVMGYQNCCIRDMTGDLKDKCQDQYMVRYISTDPTEDIAMYNPTNGNLDVYCNNNHYGECALTYKTRYVLNDYWKIGDKRIHTITEPESKEILFLFNRESVFIFNKKDSSLQEVKDMNITNLQLIDGVYIYAMTNDIPGKKLTSGFYFYDLNQLAQKAEESFNFKLKGAIVGLNSIVDYYRQDERIAFMQDYDEIKIVPLLHRNCISMIGMQKRKNYVSFLKKKDKFIALDKSNTLTTWNVTTGKVVSQYKLKVPIVTENFDIYRCDVADITYHADWYQPSVLLIDATTDVTDVDDKSFYGDRLYTSLPNNTAYTAVEQKTWRNFKIVQIVSETEVKEVCSFIHPFYGMGSYQRIYFSDDHQYMLERLVNQRAFIFKREQLGVPGKCKWRFIRRLKSFPMDLAEATYANYLFSPDLQFYLDYDQSDNQFTIMRTLDQSLYCPIPRGIMNPTAENPVKISRRFCWVNSHSIKVINAEGIEKYIEITNGQFKDINQDTIPMIDLKDFDNEKFQYYFQPKSHTLDQTEERLMRKYQRINSAMCLEQITDKELLYDSMFEIDYSLKNYTGKIVIDTSFTYIHWKLAEMLANPLMKIKLKKFTLKDLTKTLLNVFPKGNTVMHYSYKQLNNIRKMFDVVNNYNLTLKEDDVLLEIPFIQNFKGRSPLHLCVDDKNYKSAEIFLQKLSETPLDSHSRSIVDILPKLVEAGIPSFGTYLDKRQMQTKQLIQRGQRRGALICNDELDYAVNSCELWPDMDSVDKMLFSKDPRESEIKLEFLDMPKLHSYQEKIGDEFFAALADSDDITLFQYKSIQALIDYKWPLAREFTIKILFMPFIAYHLTFLIYSNVFNGQYAFEEDKYAGSMWIGHNVLAALLYLFSLYFLSNETRQLFLGGFEYFKSVWNYSDILPPILIIITVSLKLNTFYNDNYEPNNIIYTIHSVATLLMWVKLLYFLRIFKSTGYLVRTLTDVIYDMKVFLFILFIVYFGFGEAFLRLSEKSGDALFIQNYAYAWVYSFRLSVGDNATDTFDDTIQPTTLWILFVIAGILTNIVMLNLLISIISDSFAQINEKAKEANYQERARIISENGYLIPKYVKAKLDDFDKYLIIANEVADSQEDDRKAIQNKAKQIEDSLTSFKDEFNKKHESISSKLDALIEQN